MAKILDREATIKTVTVEIKALTVSGKQVTQALFKQLPEESLIDFRTSQFRGLPWGRINYHVSCDAYGEHLHVVWQKGEELRRAAVTKDPKNEPGYFTLMDRETRLWSLVAAWEFLQPPHSATVWNGFYWQRADHAIEWVSDRWPKLKINAEPDDNTCFFVDQIGLKRIGVLMMKGPRTASAREFLVEEMNAAGFENRSDLMAASRAALQERELAIVGWQSRYRELGLLDQLFIAV